MLFFNEFLMIVLNFNFGTYDVSTTFQLYYTEDVCTSFFSYRKSMVRIKCYVNLLVLSYYFELYTIGYWLLCKQYMFS